MGGAIAKPNNNSIQCRDFRSDKFTFLRCTHEVEPQPQLTRGLKFASDRFIFFEIRSTNFIYYTLILSI
ncbi:hypothetical protein CKA32_001594 [Geitlerinema sp. FC II]|nr:hypothetical protein CKA32_001594 [Geitlerinema sp. FC II]